MSNINITESEVDTQRKLEIQKCREVWHVNPKFLPVLRKVYKLNWRMSKAARAHGYSPAYARKVFKRLQKEGHEVDIKNTVVYEPQDLEREFWDGIKEGLNRGDIKTMELYARITKKIPPAGISQKVGIINKPEPLNYEEERKRYGL